ncbi:hypothetical protein SAMN05421788_106224 [Filimonas lacunae]|uniref:Uncharacterized protein n=1 Tax=Filimonas lacunae TaxID=477680 RepID=A0A173MFE5_9BACT|nr:hypothetical protein [Filimonas lacunae]BAV06161.1 hypothetical protein FLA_2177 [Filimonas lacunae]SIT25011.1 hypothetical protein SAMN05421788_106224 [Filimonas lacunae]
MTYLENVLDVIDKISDLTFQRAVWWNSEYYDPILDYSEAVNTLESFSFYDDVKNRQFSFSKEEYEEVDFFIEALLAYDSFRPLDSGMAVDGDWLKVVESAKKVKVLVQRIAEPTSVYSTTFFGYWKEHRAGIEDVPSIKDYVNETINNSYVKEKLVRYLMSGGIEVVSSELLTHAFTGERFSMSYCILTDGVWSWPQDLALYVLDYHVVIPQEWYEYIVSMDFTIPEEVKQQNPGVDWDGLLHKESASSIVMTGWREGMEKVSMIRLQRSLLELTMTEAKENIDKLLDGKEITLSVSDITIAKVFVAAANELGVDCLLK